MDYTLYVILGLIFVAIVIPILILRRFAPRLWFVFQVYVLRRKGLAEKTVKKELQDSKKHNYATFEEFLQDCPKYQIDSDTLGAMIRNIRKSVGQEFQQFVFIRKNFPTDKTAWIRREGKTLIHESGTYLKPWESEKEVIYFDIEDGRPLIDLTNEMDWKNGDMCADVITALTNSNDMAKLDGEKSNASLYTMAILGLLGLTVLMLGYDIYTNGQNTKNTLSLLTALIQKAGITIGG